MKHIFLPLIIVCLALFGSCDTPEDVSSEVYISDELSWEEEGEIEVQKYLEALEASYVYLGETYATDEDEEPYIYLSIDESALTGSYSKAEVEALLSKLAGIIYDALYYPVAYEGMEITLTQGETGQYAEYGPYIYSQEELSEMTPRLY